MTGEVFTAPRQGPSHPPTTRHEEQAQLLLKVLRLWGYFPEWRLGQLISNLHGAGPQDVFMTGDRRLDEMVDNMLALYLIPDGE